MPPRGPFFSPYQFAKMNRNNVVEFDDDYLDKHLDPVMLKEMHDNPQWVDEDGYNRGFPFTTAAYMGDKPVIVIGSKIEVGYKIVVPPSFQVVTIGL